jgi:hypothetical protein
MKMPWLWMGTIALLFSLGWAGTCAVKPSDHPSYTDLVVRTNEQAAEIRRLQTEVDSYKEFCR